MGGGLCVEGRSVWGWHLPLDAQLSTNWGGRTRTSNFPINSRAVCQLTYTPSVCRAVRQRSATSMVARGSARPDAHKDATDGGYVSSAREAAPATVLELSRASLPEARLGSHSAQRVLLTPASGLAPHSYAVGNARTRLWPLGFGHVAVGPGGRRGRDGVRRDESLTRRGRGVVDPVRRSHLGPNDVLTRATPQPSSRQRRRRDRCRNRCRRPRTPPTPGAGPESSSGLTGSRSAVTQSEEARC